MEPASSASELPLPKILRPKQAEAIRWFHLNDTLIAKLPTGYGKTLVAAGSFAQLQHRGACNRILYVVPRRNQALQAAEDVPEALSEFGITTKAVIVGDDPLVALRSHSSGTTLVFIVLIQSLLSTKTWVTINNLMQTGRWLVVVDEHHHYGGGDDAAWTGKIKSLNSMALLAMSATPSRFDKSDHFGPPQISEGYRKASQDGYVKRLSLHAYHYEIDAITTDGGVIQFTTEELAAAAGGTDPDSIDAYMSSRKMRFSPKYVSPLVTFPLDRIIDLRCGTGMVKAQMLIQAMSCSHAKCVVDQVRALVPDNIRVDWVGTGPNGRTDDENKTTLVQFCPPKDKVSKTRPWTLDILVNVGMAGEGTDCMDVSEIVYLTPANITISNLQMAGRGARIMKADPQPTCHINVDSGSEMAKHIGAAVMDLFDDEPPPGDPDDDDTREPGEREYVELPDHLSWMIADVRLVDIRSEPMFKVVAEETTIDLRRRFNREPTKEEIDEAAERALTRYLNRSNNRSAILAQLRDQVEHAASKLAGLVIRRLQKGNMRIERTLIGDLRKRINTKKKIAFGAVKDADEDSLDKHWQWLKDLETEILSSPGIEGVPRWLR